MFRKEKILIKAWGTGNMYRSMYYWPGILKEPNIFEKGELFKLESRREGSGEFVTWKFSESLFSRESGIQIIINGKWKPKASVDYLVERMNVGRYNIYPIIFNNIFKDKE